MTLTTAEVADLIGVSEGRVRQLVMAGELVPLVRGSRPLTFAEIAVVEWEFEHRRDNGRLSRLAAEWRDSA